MGFLSYVRGMITWGIANDRVCSGITTVKSDKRQLAAHLQISEHAICTVHQVHGTGVVCIDRDDHNPLFNAEIEADAIVTNTTNFCIAVKVADCCGIVLYDPTSSVIAVVHSGWRGTAKGVVSATISTMQTVFDVDPTNLHAWLSPCASAARYQVGTDVFSVLRGYCTPDTSAVNRWFFDNHHALCDELRSFDVQPNSIVCSTECTIANPSYHSYRRDGAAAGRGLVFAKLSGAVT